MQQLHRLESSPFHCTGPPALYPLTSLMHSNWDHTGFLGCEPFLGTLVALTGVFWQLLLILHASPIHRPVEMLLLLLLGLPADVE